MEKQPILTAKGVCKSFAHNGGQVHILNGIDLTLYAGDFTVIMGASGSGKSTLLYALSGMDRATAGEINYKGSNLVQMREKDLTALRCGDFGFIFQQMHLVSNLSLKENITVPGYLSKSRTAAETDARADQLLEQMGLSHIASHLPSQCSGGEQQRCAVARAVIHEPALLFADEPTGALNKKNTVEVLDLLTALNRGGQSILMVTHDPRAARRANRVVYLSDGRIISELLLPPYDAAQEKQREEQVGAWLTSLEW
ncbi:MAG: ABC transporter ATP-binding protein [Oscillospiraceae bacterium]|nr:ABC transporter ATP-binding protein [Oscillospiraceae bacterium]